MPRTKYEIQPGNEIRGMMIKLYPTKDTEEKLKILENDLRSCWNWLVKQTEEVLAARKAYAVKYNLVSKPPVKPNSNGLSPEETKEIWEKYKSDYIAWAKAVHIATDKIECCSWRPSLKKEVERFGFKHDYQFFSSHLFQHSEIIKPCAHAYQALVKNYFSGQAKEGKGLAKNQRRKKFRRSIDSMPLQVRSGTCFELGDFGSRGKEGKSFYNCRVSFNGLKINGRLPGRAPWGRVLEGVSITHQADGWWASIKQEIPIRKLPTPTKGTIIGIDVGLDAIVAMSDGTLIRNSREKQYIERIAGRQQLKLPVGRIQQAASRHIRHVLYNDLIKYLSNVETIRIEKVSSKLGQMSGSSKMSSIRLVRNMLVDRYGEKSNGGRVEENNPSYTSQLCSVCGHRDKEAWDYKSSESKKCICPKCNNKEHRDINAAKNIALDKVEWNNRLMAAGIMVARA